MSNSRKRLNKQTKNKTIRTSSLRSQRQKKVKAQRPTRLSLKKNITSEANKSGGVQKESPRKRIKATSKIHSEFKVTYLDAPGSYIALLRRFEKRPPPDKTSGHNFETAMYHHEYKNLHGKPR
jgi:hypothetical protein